MTKPVWTGPEGEKRVAKLRLLWPQFGRECVSEFPGLTISALEQKAWRLDLKSPGLVEFRRKEAERKAAGTAQVKRNGRSCFGYIKGGPAPSIWHMAEKAQKESTQ